MTAAETISKNWNVKEPYEIELTKDQLELLSTGNVIMDSMGDITYIFPFVIKETKDGKFYVNSVIDLHKDVEESDDFFFHPEKIVYTIEK